jgi:hypothetical protein
MTNGGRWLCSALVLVALKSASSAGQCPAQPQFEFQLAHPARLQPHDSAGVPRLVPHAAHAPNSVEFLIDTSGAAVMKSLRPIALKDTALYIAFSRVLRTWRFEPAKTRDGCVAVERMLAGIEDSRAPRR